MAEKWYDKSAAQAVLQLGSNSETGLSRTQVIKKRSAFGLNVIYPSPKHSFTAQLKKAVTDFTSILLALTAFIAVLFNEDVYILLILALIVYNAVSLYAYFRSKRLIEELQRFALPNAKVMREGSLSVIRHERLVPGDIIYISAGDVVPADARLIDSDDLMALETNLTNVAHSVRKLAKFESYRDLLPYEQKNMLFATSIITRGSGKAVVCATGSDALACISKRSPRLYSQDKLRVLSVLKKYCSAWSLTAIASIMVLTVINLVVGFVSGKSGSVFTSFLTGLSLAVSTMSEMYAELGYIVIACGIFAIVGKLRPDASGALIKNPAKLEKMKELSCLLIQKDGVLTVRSYKVEKIFANENLYSPGEKKFLSNCGGVIKKALVSTALYGSKKLGVLNSSNENIYTPEEDAIISLAEQFRLYNISLDTEFPLLDHAAVSGDSRFETSLVKSGEEFMSCVRGDLEAILVNCDSYYLNGSIYAMTPEDRNTVRLAAQKLENESYRILAVASKKTHYNNLRRIGACQSQMTFEGFLAIREPLLRGCAMNISRCREAGLKVLLFSDVRNRTARVTARTLGIIRSENEIADDATLAAIPTERLSECVTRYRMFEAISQQQKLRLIKALKSDGEVIGVLSDSLDDLPYTSECDITFTQSDSLYKGSRDATLARTKAAPVIVKKDIKSVSSDAVRFLSDVIISSTDRKGGGGFNALITAVSGAKMIYINLMRMVSYLFSSQLSRFMVVLLSIIFGQSFLTPIQILIGGLFVDFAAVLIISLKRPTVGILSENEQTEKMMTRPFTSNYMYLILGGIWGILNVLIPYSFRLFGSPYDPSVMSGVFFLSYTLTQFLVLYCVMCPRKQKGAEGISRIFFISFLIFILFFALCLLIPSLGGLFGIFMFLSPVWFSALILPVLITAGIFIYRFIVSHSEQG